MFGNVAGMLTAASHAAGAHIATKGLVRENMFRPRETLNSLLELTRRPVQRKYLRPAGRHPFHQLAPAIRAGYD